MYVFCIGRFLKESLISRYLYKNLINHLYMKSLLLSIFLSFVGLSSYSQSYEVKGNVVDTYGSPLPGVTIVVKNTTKGASTDFDGNFVISNIQKGETLVFSFIGYATKEVVVVNNNPIKVVLSEDTQSLDEVVVVGYGTQKKSVVTGGYF